MHLFSANEQLLLCYSRYCYSFTFNEALQGVACIASVVQQLLQTPLVVL